MARGGTGGQEDCAHREGARLTLSGRPRLTRSHLGLTVMPFTSNARLSPHLLPSLQNVPSRLGSVSGPARPVGPGL